MEPYKNVLSTFRTLYRSVMPATSAQHFGAIYRKRGVRRENRMERGALIVFEGCDHSGKTTQCSKLVTTLQSSGTSVEPLRFPDRTTAVGQMINGYLSNNQNLEDHCVHLLFSANRWEREPLMMKLLLNGTSLIVDRYAYSGVAFTAAKEGFDIDWCKKPDAGLPQPDAVIYLDLSTEAAAKRGTFGGERYEKTDFQRKVAENFQKLKEPNWKVINADKQEDILHEELLKIVKDVIDGSKNKPIEKLWISLTSDK